MGRPVKRRPFVALACLAAIALGAGRGRAASPSPDPNPRPPAMLIRGVPFVPWRETAGWNYSDKELRNPSDAAAAAMILGYWGKDPRLAEKVTSLDDVPGMVVEASQAGELQLLKTVLAQRVPVFLATALTPIAHPVSPEVGAYIETAPARFPKAVTSGKSSRTLGMMVTLEGHRLLRPVLKSNSILEVMTMSCRVAVGYDDARGVIVLHDPTLGPAFEMSYADFERAWAAADHGWMIAHPRTVGPATFPTDSLAYRPRNGGERAAEHLVYGYALASAGRYDEAEARFRGGLGLESLDPAHSFLLHNELAFTLAEQKRFDDAVAAAEEAARLLPEHAQPQQFLSRVYRLSSLTEADRKSRDAEHRAKALEGDLGAAVRIATTLPCDLWVMNLSAVRGWCGP